MNPSIIDSLLKVSHPAARPAPVDSPLNGREFEKHLRQAATDAPEATKPAPKTKTSAAGLIADKPAVASDQEQNSAANSDQAPLEELEGSEDAAKTAEQKLANVQPDEVLLSAAATAIEEGATTVVTPTALTEETLVSSEGILPTPQEGEQKQGSSTGAPLPEFTGESAVDELRQLVGEEIKATVSVAQAAVDTEVTIEADFQPAVDQQPPSQPAKATAAQPVTAQLKGRTKEPETKSGKSESNGSEDESSHKRATLEKSTVDALTSAVEPVEAVDKTEGHTKRAVEAASPAPTSHTSANAHIAPQSAETQLTQVAASAAESRESDSQMPTIDRARFVQRVANAFRSAQQNDGHIQLRLSPPELGSLRIEIAVRHGVLSANLETETADARRVLLDNLPALRTRLAEQDIRIEKFEVDIRREGGQPDGQAGAQDRQAQQQSQRASAQNRIRTPQQSEVIAARIPRLTPPSTDANLDVRI